MKSITSLSALAVMFSTDLRQSFYLLSLGSPRQLLSYEPPLNAIVPHNSPAHRQMFGGFGAVRVALGAPFAAWSDISLPRVTIVYRIHAKSLERLKKNTHPPEQEGSCRLGPFFQLSPSARKAHRQAVPSRTNEDDKLHT